MGKSLWYVSLLVLLLIVSLIPFNNFQNTNEKGVIPVKDALMTNHESLTTSKFNIQTTHVHRDETSLINRNRDHQSDNNERLDLMNNEYSSLLDPEFMSANANEPLIANNDTFTLNEDTVLTEDVSFNDGPNGTVRLQDGGFESGSFDYWASSDTSLFTSPYKGDYAAFVSWTGMYVGQDISIPVNSLDKISFYQRAVSGVANTWLNITYSDGNISQFSFYPTYSWTQNFVDSSELDSNKTISNITFFRETEPGGANAIDEVEVAIKPFGNYSILSDVNNGTLNLNSDGTFDYTPNTDFFGNDSFSYEVSDGATSATATVELTIYDVSETPIAVDDWFSGLENSELIESVWNNDTDVDNSTQELIYSVVKNVNFGSLQLNSTGNFVYTPDVDFAGKDSFIYRVSDGTSSSTATVTLIIHNVNSAPIATNDTFSMNEDSEYNGDVSSNDIDVDSATGKNAIENHDFETGSLSSWLYSGAFAASGYYYYNGDYGAGFFDNSSIEQTMYYPVVAFDEISFYSNIPSGTELIVTFEYADGSETSFTFYNTYWWEHQTIDPSQLESGKIVTNVKFQRIEISSSGVATALDDIVIKLVNEMSHTVLSDVSNGTLLFNNDGSFTYTPNTDFYGTDTFTYQVSDGEFTSNATVTIRIKNVGERPNAVDDSFSGYEETKMIGDVSINDNDVDNSTLELTYSLLVDVSSGNLVLYKNGSFIYTPYPDFDGTDSFKYQVSDGFLSHTAIVTLTIININDAPVASDDTFSTSENTEVNGDVSNNDIDVDSSLTYSLVTDVSSGSLILNEDGTFSYVPDPDFIGSDSFVYQVSDGEYTDQATVTINVEISDDSSDDTIEFNLPINMFMVIFTILSLAHLIRNLSRKEYSLK